MTIGTKKIPKTAEMPLITHSLSQPVYLFMYVQKGIKITERVGGGSSLVQSYTIIIEILCNIYIINPLITLTGQLAYPALTIYTHLEAFSLM